MSSISTALNGIQTASDNLDRAAYNVANFSTPGYENVNLAAQVVALLTSGSSIHADALVIRTEDALTQSLLDIRA